MIPESFGEGGEVGVPGEAWGGHEWSVDGIPICLRWQAADGTERQKLTGASHLSTLNRNCLLARHIKVCLFVFG